MVNYKELYLLQDRVLGNIFHLGTPFYLTGGTALHRFYYNLRYSDDLDSFPLDWLKKINIIQNIEMTSENIKTIIEDITLSRDNSLFSLSN